MSVRMCWLSVPKTANKGGRVIEMLSEHTLQGWMQGYTLTGRHALFPSYERWGAFTTVEPELIFEIASSVSFRLWSRWVAMWPCTQSWRLLNHSQQQYAKFLKMALETKWRSDVSGLTYIETSTLWRQEHNGVLSGSLFSMTDIWPADWNNQVIPIKTRAWLDRSFLFLDISLEFIYLPMQTRALPRLIIAFGQRIVSLISFKQTNMLDINLVIGSKTQQRVFWLLKR